MVPSVATIAMLLILGDASSVYKKASGAVVKISAGEKAGTAFAIDGGRLMVTNQHVVGGSPTVKIEGSPATWGTVVAKDVSRDIALIKPSKAHPTSLSLGLQLPRPGEKVYVIGTPLGFLTKSISEGIVSGVRGQGADAYIQMTAEISPGSSGSPLLDGQGRAIGVATFTLVDGNGLNFGVSAKAVDDLKLVYVKKRAEKDRLSKEISKQSDDGLRVTQLFCVADLPMMSEPSTKSRRIGSIRKDSLVMVKRSRANGWSQVSVDGRLFGFVQSSGLEKTKGVEITLAKGGWPKYFEVEASEQARVKRLLKLLDDGSEAVSALKKLREMPTAALFTIYDLYQKRRDHNEIPNCGTYFGIFERKAKPFLAWMLTPDDPDSILNALEGIEMLARIQTNPGSADKDAYLHLLGTADYSYLFEPSMVEQIGSLIYSRNREVQTSALRVFSIIPAPRLSTAFELFALSLKPGVGSAAFLAYLRSMNSSEEVLLTIEFIKENVEKGVSDNSPALSSISYRKEVLRDYVRSIGYIDTPTSKAVLNKLLLDADQSVVLGALDAIEISESKDFFEGVRGLQQNPDPQVRINALEVLIKLDLRRATTFIVEMSYSSDEKNRSYAAYASDSLSKSEGHALRMRLLKDRSDSVRYMALLAADLDSHEEEFLVKLLTQDPDPEIRKKALERLERK